MPKTHFSLLTQGREVVFESPAVMGIVNLSPDSFYQVRQGVNAAVDCVAKMVKDGVSMVDLGAEATNPKAILREDESEQIAFELEQLLPAIEAVRARFDVFLSVDTSRAEVMTAVAKAGADMINDQRALSLPGALEAATNSRLAICLMHSILPRREPGSSPPEALMAQIVSHLESRIDACLAAGIQPEQLVVDPCFGGGYHYGRNTAENLHVLTHLTELEQFHLPILIGWSRKSMLGEILGREIPDRLAGSLAAACAAAFQGANIIRAHDVEETVDVCRFLNAMWKS